jgi:hypothetical protein
VCQTVRGTRSPFKSRAYSIQDNKIQRMAGHSGRIGQQDAGVTNCHQVGTGGRGRPVSEPGERNGRAGGQDAPQVIDLPQVIAQMSI